MARLSIDNKLLVKTSLGIINTEGLGALSMRTLASTLNIEAASLYYHVKNKEDLLQRIVDTVARDALLLPSKSRDWQTQLSAVAHQMRKTLQANPGVVPLIGTRPVSSEISDASTTPIITNMCTSQGIDIERAIFQLSSVMVFIIGHALAEVGNFPEPPTAPQEYYDTWFELGLNAMIQGFTIIK